MLPVSLARAPRQRLVIGNPIGRPSQCERHHILAAVWVVVDTERHNTVVGPGRSQRRPPCPHRHERHRSIPPAGEQPKKSRNVLISQERKANVTDPAEADHLTQPLSPAVILRTAQEARAFSYSKRNVGVSTFGSVTSSNRAGRPARRARSKAAGNSSVTVTRSP